MTECKFCYRPITQEIIDEKKRRKQENARSSRWKSLSRGSKIGRQKKRNDDQIRALRASGMKIRAIAVEIGLSTGTVMRALKLPTQSNQ